MKKDRCEAANFPGKRRRLRRWARWGLVVFLLVAVGTFGIAWWVAGRIVAPVPTAVGSPPDDLPLEEVVIESESGSRLAGWFGRGQQNKGTVVLLHPIRGSRLTMLGRARLFLDAGYSVLLIDLQAHGESPGQHITAGYLERLDVAAAVAFARSRSGSAPVAVLGVSLGGAATLLASPLDVDAVIFESVYPTIDEAVRNRVRMRLGNLSPMVSELLLMQLEPRLGFSRSTLRPIDHIHQVGCPLLVVTGSEDQHTTLAETQRMYQRAVDPKQLLVIDGAAHVDLLRFAPDEYGSAVLGFLDSSLQAGE